MNTDKKTGRVLSRFFLVVGTALVALGVVGTAAACDSTVRNQEVSYRQ